VAIAFNRRLFVPDIIIHKIRAIVYYFLLYSVAALDVNNEHSGPACEPLILWDDRSGNSERTMVLRLRENGC